MIDSIFNIGINVVESFLMSYFCIRYFDVEKNKEFVLGIMTLILSASVTISNMYVTYDNLLPIVDLIVIVGVLSIFIKNRDIYEKIFIAIFVYLLLHSASNITVLIAAILTSTRIENIGNLGEIQYYLTLVLSKLLFILMVHKLSSIKTNVSIKVSKKHWIILILIATIVLVGAQLLGEVIYAKTVNYMRIYLVMTTFTLMTIIIYYLFIEIKNDAAIRLKNEIEVSQLKGIESQYIELRSLKERNEKIKHDLEYFLDIINNHRKEIDKNDLSDKIEATIKKIENGGYQIYCEDKIFNSLINTIKGCASVYEKQVNILISVDDKALPLDTYNVIKDVADFVIAHCKGEIINLEIKSSDGCSSFKFTYLPKDKVKFKEEIIHSELKGLNGGIFQDIDDTIGVIEVVADI